MVDDQIKVTHDNNGRFYRIKMDLAKEGSEIWDLTPYFKGRVGDNRFGLQVVWTYQGRLLDTTGMKPYIEGNVGNYSFDDKKDLQLAPDAATVRYTGTPSDCQSGGRATYYFPEQMFPRDGIFKGYIGLLDDRDDSSQPHISGVTVWFKVLPGISQMGHACDVYISDLDKSLQDYKEALRQHNIDYENQLNSNNAEFQRQVQQVITDARNAYNYQVANSRDAMNALDAEVKANRAELTNINDHLAGVEQQIAIHDIVTIPEHQKDIENISNAIDERLANVKTAPVAVENATVLQQRYPNGADGIFVTADTGHKWLYLSGMWTDCGEYQAIGIGSELIDPLKHQLANDERNIINNYALIDQNANQIKSHDTKINSIQSVGKLTWIHIVDQQDNRIIDQNGNELIAKKWLVTTDKTLTRSDLPADAKAVGNALETDSRLIKSNTNNIQDVMSIGQFAYVKITNQEGNVITDQNNNEITAEKWLVITDKTLTQSDLPADAKAVGDALKFNATKYNIPVLYLSGKNILSLHDKTKTLKDEVTYWFPKYHVRGTIKKFKVQGASSAYLPKKNYTLNFDQDFTVFPTYGKQHKYVIKANYTDPSQALNVVNAKLWGKIRATHVQATDLIQNNQGNYITDDQGNRILIEADPQLSIGGNFGAVDGFPIAVYINDQYWGLYSFNIPKDDWMAKMPSKEGYAIVDALNPPQAGFQQETNMNDNGLEIQFCGTKDTNWVVTSINKLIDAVKAHYTSAADFDTAVSPLVDMDSVYDYCIFSVLINNNDGLYRNYLLQTFDGNKWYFAAYDLDETFGRTYDFDDHLLADTTTNDWRRTGMTFENLNDNRLFYQLWKFHKDEILKRAKALVESLMSASAVDTEFVDYARHIPLGAYIEEAKIWPGTTNASVDNINRIGRWYMERVQWFNHHYFSNDDKLEQLETRLTSLEKSNVAGK